MNPVSQLPADDIAATLSALVDGRLSAQELERLEAQLLTDPDALDRYCEFMDVECLMAWELKARAAGSGLLPDSGRGTSLIRRAGAWLAPVALGGFAAAVAIAAFVIPATPSRRAAETAVLTATEQASWSMATAPQADLPLPAGPLRLAEGSAQITFPSGAVVAMQGPAEVEVLGPNRLFLRRGQITPFVPESAHGFAVVTPTGEVIDLGTEFSMHVGADGKTDVFVIGGAVDVAGGHADGNSPMRLTQGFATQVTALDPSPKVTRTPLLIDHFDAGTTGLDWAPVDPDYPPAVRDGSLWIPIDGGPHRKDPIVQVVLEHDCSPIVGSRATISFKATLPSTPGLSKERWVALGIDPGQGPTPWAHSADATAAVLVSPSWQVGMMAGAKRIRQQQIWPRMPLFPRGSEAVGPYQVVVTLDDSPASHATHGGTTISAMVNGLEFVRNHVIAMSPTPRLSFQTFLMRSENGGGHASIDDFSISIDMPARSSDL